MGKIYDTGRRRLDNLYAEQVDEWVRFMIQGEVAALNCGSASVAGNLASGQPATGIAVSVPYTGGNGGAYFNQAVASTGVTGLIATLNAGTLANGSGSLSYTLSGTPSGGGTASFVLSIGGQSCILSIPVPGGIAALNCGSAVVSGALTALQPASGVSVSVPYTGGNGGAHNGQTANSTGVTGLTATLAAGTFANGAGSLNYLISGTPASGGTASFALSIGGKSCTLNLGIPGAIGALNCGSAVLSGTLIAGKTASGVSISVPYTEGNGGAYPGQSVNSTGVTGLTATLAAGSFAGGNGSLSYTISGTPAGNGTASFALNIGGQSCTLTASVAAGAISALNCGSATLSGALVSGQAAFNVSVNVPYTGGNGGAHTGQTVNSTGVTGLTATLATGNFANGNGSLSYVISGTPAGSGTAGFALSIGGQSCTLNASVAAGSISALNCGNATLNGPLASGQPASGVSVSIPYSGGNGGSHAGQTVTATGVTGLTATLAAGTFANGSGSLSYIISGTPSGGGTASFALSIGGQSCTLSLTIPGSVGALNCGSAVMSGTLAAFQTASVVNVTVPYSGGNGGPYTTQTVNSTGVAGLAATLAAGTFANGSGSLFFVISGTPTAAGNAAFALNMGGQSCNLSLTVTAGTGCHAKVNATDYKNFMCHNLGSANTAADPFTPSWEINGGYWQWGRKGPDPSAWLNTNTAHFAHGPTGAGASQANEGAVSGWSIAYVPQNAWKDSTKTAYDPCPAGYRVPTQAQWSGILNNNTQSAVGSWTSSSTNYDSGRFFGASLLLPAAGNRNDINGSLYTRGSYGYYWSSTNYGSGRLLLFQNSSSSLNGYNFTNGFSVRCIAENPGAVSALNCGSTTQSGPLIAGTAAVGISASLPYSIGNGGPYNGQTLNSYGVTGLTATLAAGRFANGSGSLNFVISGTPSDEGAAQFSLNIGGQLCTLTLTVTEPATISALNCSSATLTGNLLSGQPATGVYISIPYTGGNGGGYYSQTVASTGVAGLAATLTSGSIANGSGTFIFNITGTPATTGTASFAPSFNGQSCTFVQTVLTSPTCRAKVNPTDYKTFMCLNLGAANTAADPFTPSWEINGGYWQWGRKGPDPSQWLNTNTEHFAHGPTGPGPGQANNGSINNWSYNYAPNGAWSDNTKTVNDPCPTGYRVPTRTDWEGVLNNNTQTAVGTWNDSPTNYSSGNLFGAELLLPASGLIYDGYLENRGTLGYYWSSTENTNNINIGRYLRIDYNSNYISDTSKTLGFSIRCVAE
jgi:uncharacterized protein (TIGR02145 family)